jgi:hypothetical protein
VVGADNGCVTRRFRLSLAFFVGAALGAVVLVLWLLAFAVSQHS